MTEKIRSTLRLAAVVLVALLIASCNGGGGASQMPSATGSAAPPGTVLNLDADEVWVIERDPTLTDEGDGYVHIEGDAGPTSVAPGQGELRLVRRGDERAETEVVPVPLEHTAVMARVSTYAPPDERL